MNVFHPLAIMASAVGLVFSPTIVGAAYAPPEGPLAHNALYQRMVRESVGIRSYQADIEVHTKLKSFPPASFTFRGHSYFKAPDKQAVVFDDVPAIMKGMVHDSPSIAPAPLWPSTYDVSVLGDDGNATTFHLVPKNADAASQIEFADVQVDDRTALVTRFSFQNKNGSTVETDNTYQRVAGHQLVAAQTGTARGHGYHADVTTTFSNYQLNVPIPDSVFEQNQ